MGQDGILFDNTVEALGRIGPEARAAIPALNRRLHEGRAGYDLVVWALDRIGSPAVQILLDEFHRDADPYMANILAWHGSAPKPGRPSRPFGLTSMNVRSLTGTRPKPSSPSIDWRRTAGRSRSDGCRSRSCGPTPRDCSPTSGRGRWCSGRWAGRASRALG